MGAEDDYWMSKAGMPFWTNPGFWMFLIMVCLIIAMFGVTLGGW